MLATARTFPRGARPAGVLYNSFLLATRMIRKFPELRMPPEFALAEILRMGFTQHRHVSAFLATRALSGDAAGSTAAAAFG